MEFDPATRECVTTLWGPSSNKSVTVQLCWLVSAGYPCIAPYCTGDQASFAYISARDRWPVILVLFSPRNRPCFLRSCLSFSLQTQVIDDVFRATREGADSERTAEGKRIVEELAKLKYEVQHDRVLTCVLFHVPTWREIPYYRGELLNQSLKL